MSTERPSSAAPKILPPEPDDLEAPAYRKGYLGMGGLYHVLASYPRPEEIRMPSDFGSQIRTTRMNYKKAAGGNPVAVTKGESRGEYRITESGERPINAADYGETVGGTRYGTKDTLEAERPINAVDYGEAVGGTRHEVKDTLEAGKDGARDVASPTPPPVNIGRVVASLLPPGSEDEREAHIEHATLYHISELLRKNTLEAHEEAVRIMKENGLMASQRWDGVHVGPDPKKRHNLSRAAESRTNTFAKWLSDRVELGENSVILELGSGYGNDALYFARHTKAHVIGVDISQEAVTKAQRNITKHGRGAKEQISLSVGNFLEMLKMGEGAGVAMVYSHSTLHYQPPLILRDKTFPLIANVLRSNQEGAKWGKLCMAMKSADSASAKKKSQIRLLPGNPYNPSIDKDDEMFRIYLQTEKEVRELLEPSFDIEYMCLVPLPDYDRKGDTEYVWYIIANPKPLKKAA